MLSMCSSVLLCEWLLCFSRKLLQQAGLHSRPRVPVVLEFHGSSRRSWWGMIVSWPVRPIDTKRSHFVNRVSRSRPVNCVHVAANLNHGHVQCHHQIGTWCEDFLAMLTCCARRPTCATLLSQLAPSSVTINCVFEVSRSRADHKTPRWFPFLGLPVTHGSKHGTRAGKPGSRPREERERERDTRKP